MWTSGLCKQTLFPSTRLVGLSKRQSHFLPVSLVMHSFLSGQPRDPRTCVFPHSLHPRFTSTGAKEEAPPLLRPTSTLP